jgi:hypothetical protein
MSFAPTPSPPSEDARGQVRLGQREAQIEHIWTGWGPHPAVEIPERGEPQQTIVLQSLRKRQWIHPERRVRIEWIEPSQQVLRVPLSYD